MTLHWKTQSSLPHVFHLDSSVGLLKIYWLSIQEFGFAVTDAYPLSMPNGFKSCLQALQPGRSPVVAAGYHRFTRELISGSGSNL